MDMPETVRFRFTERVTYRGVLVGPGSEAEVSACKAERWAKQGLGVIVGDVNIPDEESPGESGFPRILTRKTTKPRAKKKKQTGRST